MRGALPGRGLILTDPLPFFFLPRLNSAPAGSGHWAFRWRRFHASYDLLLTPTLPLPTFEVGHLLPPAAVGARHGPTWRPSAIPST
jgi:Asp-tRNA(Asn)/Glu-tRNA(Gln) amidotransferase A subunit family amidase